MIDYLPSAAALRPGQAHGAAVAVIDVLRATTTMTSALVSGCRRIWPCASLRAARTQARRLRAQGETVWLAGERGGLRPQGFDAGNSPREMRTTRGQTLVLTTSNGTRALVAARGADALFIACLNNADAAARALARVRTRTLLLLAAGDAQAPSPEDALAARWILRNLRRLRPELTLSARAQHLAQGPWPRARLRFLLATPHGRELVRLGFRSDLVWASRLNTTSVVGRMTSRGFLQRAG